MSLYDLLSVILIRRGGKNAGEGIYEYLNGIFNGNKLLIEKYSDVIWDSKMIGEVERMSGLGNAIFEQGLEQGLEQGREQGLEQGLEQGREQERTATIYNMLQHGFSKSVIISMGYSEEELLKATQSREPSEELVSASPGKIIF